MTREIAEMVTQYFKPVMGDNIEALLDLANNAWVVVVYPVPDRFDLTPEEIENNLQDAVGRQLRVFMDQPETIIIVSEAVHFHAYVKNVVSKLVGGIDDNDHPT